MADIFYQGEDIALIIELFEDDVMGQISDLTSTDVDMMIYTKNNGKLITASTKHGANIYIVKTNLNQKLLLTIPATLTRNLECGVLTVEMKVTNNINNSIKISVNSSIRIEQSLIGKM